MPINDARTVALILSHDARLCPPWHLPCPCSCSRLDHSILTSFVVTTFPWPCFLRKRLQAQSPQQEEARHMTSAADAHTHHCRPAVLSSVVVSAGLALGDRVIRRTSSDLYSPAWSWTLAKASPSHFRRFVRSAEFSFIRSIIFWMSDAAAANTSAGPRVVISRGNACGRPGRRPGRATSMAVSSSAFSASPPTE